MLKPEPPKNGSVPSERNFLVLPLLPAKAKRIKVKKYANIWAPVFFSGFILPSRRHWLTQDICWIRVRPNWFKMLPEFFQRPDACVGVDYLSSRHRTPKKHSPTVPESSNNAFVRGQRMFYLFLPWIFRMVPLDGVPLWLRSHIPVFDPSAVYRRGKSTTWNFNNISDSQKTVERPRTLTK